MKRSKADTPAYSKHPAEKRPQARPRQRGVALLLCACMLLSLIDGVLVPRAYAADAGAAEGYTVHVTEDGRVADPDTMDDYLNRLLTAENGSRYAGRVWTDKTVFAYGDTARKGAGSGHFDGDHTITLDMATDGYVGSVGFNADFAHVFSTLASSQVVNEYPPSPIDMVLVLDVSSSMGDATEPAAGNMFAEIQSRLREYFSTGAGSDRINGDEAFKKYYEERKGAGKTKAATLADFAVEQTFEHTRFLNLIYSANRVIEQLMANNPENRVSVVVYDRRATVVMPLAHYTANEKTLAEINNGDVYDTSYLGKSPHHQDGATQIISDVLNDEVFGYLAPFFDGHNGDEDSGSSSDPYDGHHPTDYVEVEQATVVATAKDTVDAAGNSIQTSNITGTLRVAGTNTHAGLTAGMEQLANAQDTTLTAALTNGQTATVPRIPAVIVMTDGGSNTVANGPWYDPDYDTPVQRSDHKNEWSSVVVTQYLLTAAYLKSAVEKNYSAYMALGKEQDLPVYTVGVDLRDDSDSWVPARLYPMMDPGEYFTTKDDVPQEVPNPSADSGSLPLASDEGNGSRSNEGIIGNAYQNWEKWLGATSDDPTMQFPFAHWSDSDSIAKARFQQQEGKTWQGVYYNNYIIPFEQDEVNHKDVPLTQGKVEYYRNDTDKVTPDVYYNQLWHGWDGDEISGDATTSSTLWDNTKKDDEFTSEHDYDDDVLGTATFWSFSNALATVGDNGSPYTVGGNEYKADYLAPRIIENDDSADGETQHENTRVVEAVTQQDMADNINYVTKFYDVSSAQMDSVFETILAEVLGQVFVPISGDNDAGVGDSITYQDPIGQYMEIKNGAITAKGGTYDMSLLLFGEMHGLVRAGVYDYKWNDEWMEVHATELKGEKALAQGWYKGDAKDAISGGNGPVPVCAGYNYDESRPEDAWADGWVYRLNFTSLVQYVPIVDAPEKPDQLSSQAKNTVYTVYRFACPAEDRNALRRNPIYGDVPQDLKDKWDALETKPADNSEYADVPGVYRLSDIRVWVEDTGDFVDTDGAITPNSGYDRSLYVNIPAAAIPTELATITLGREGVLSYETNLGSDHPEGREIKNDDGSTTKITYEDYCHQSTPLRLFYAVGLEEALILRDKDGNQTGVDFNAISPEYISSHTVEGQDYVWFISNFYSGTRYNGYATDDVSRTRGDPTVTFSPGADNRYYVFQKPLPLYAHAYRVQTDGGLASVDKSTSEKFDANKGGNGGTTWEKGEKGGANWAGGQYMGTYTNEAAFQQALKDKGDGKTITDSNGIKYEYVEDGIVFLQEDMLQNVTSQSDGGYAEGAVSFSSDDYFFLLVEFYVPGTGTGVDNEKHPVPGTKDGRMVQYALARKGSEFGSGFASDQIDNGDMLCWTDINGKLNLEFDYLSKTDTGDLTRGRPTFEKLTYNNEESEKKLENYLKDTCHIKDDVLSEQVKYWTEMQKDPLVQAALKAAMGGEDTLTKDEFNKYFGFTVAARPGGIRSGDMSSNLQYKGTSYDGTTQLYNKNVTKTSNTYYLPTVSDHSGTGDQVIINNYLGNNGRLEIANQSLHVTKMLAAPEGFELTAAQKNETFNYQIFVQGVTGTRTAVKTDYNEYSGEWERRLAYIDILTDNSDLVMNTNNTRALFVHETDSSNNSIARHVVEVEEDGEKVYYYANPDGTAGENKVTESNPTLYYLYLPSNGTTEESQQVRRLYQAADYEGADKGDFDHLNNNGVTTYVGEGTEHPEKTDNHDYAEATDERPAGTRTYWATDAELIPVTEVQEAENEPLGDPAGEPATFALESVSSGGVWKHEEHREGDTNGHHLVASHTALIRKSGGETSLTELTSPYATRSQYMTVELEFGVNANAGDGSGEPKTKMEVSDLYDTIIPSGDRPDLFGSLDAATIAKSTAEFTLKHGEGLLLTGLDNRITYRFTEKLTEAQLAKGYTLQEISHVQQRGSDSIYRPGTQEIPIYTKDGATYGDQYPGAVDKKTENGLTWAGAPDATENKEPFAHTNAVMWEYYATMDAGASGNHHQPAGAVDEQEKTIQVWKEGSPNTYDTVEKSHTVSDNPNCTEWNSETKTGCDVTQDDGSILHYMYRDGVLIDPHYNGEASTYLRNMARYGVSPTVHFGVKEEPDQTKVPATSSTDYTGVYSVFGNTGWFEEQVNYINTFEPGAISITKELAGETVTDKDRESEFGFTLTLDTATGVGESREGIYGYTVTDGTRTVKQGKLVPLGKTETEDNDIVADSANTWSFTLQAGQTMTVNGLPVASGYTYAVKESSYPGYNVTETGSDVNGTVPAKSSAPVQVTFTNTKKMPEPAKVNLKLKKEVTGEGFTWADQKFTFLVTPNTGNPEGDPIEGVHTVDVTPTAAVAVFDGVEFKAPGTYKYTVSEQPSSIPGISTDGKTYAVVVTVSEEYDAKGIYTGKLKAEVTVNGVTVANDAVAFTFTNTYDKTKITVPFNAKKVLEGGNLKADQFSFELKEGNSVLETVKNDADGSVTFTPKTFTETGNHTYTIREVTGGDTDITYDETIYTVTVEITQEGGALKSTVTYESDKASSTATDLPTFTNKVEVKPGSLHVAKRVTGAGDKTQEFEFTVTFEGDELSSITTDKEIVPVGGVYTFTLKHNESVTFSNIPAGTAYTVTEAEAEGYTTTMSPGASGTIEAGRTDTVTVTNDKPDNPPPPPEEPAGSLTVHKTVAGGGEEAAGKVYTFDVTGPEGYSETLTVTGSGSATLTDLVPGEYTVTERDAEIEGYELTVTGGGSVTVTADTAAEVTVTNTYTEEKKGSLTVTKAVAGEGKALEGLEFSFTVTGPDGYTETFTLKNGESKTLTDLTPGAYTVTEADASVEGYTLETTGTGGVEVTAATPAEVAVTNIYTEEGKGSLTVTKAVVGEGAALTDKEFTFTVTGPDDFTESFTLKNGESKTLTDLTPGAYTVTEADAAVEGYTLETTGTGGVEVTAETPAEVTVTNIYTEEGKGSLTVTKTVVGGGTEAANKTYTFDVTGPNGYSETLTVTGSGSATLTDLVPGEYTVTERDAQIEGYKLTVTGGGNVAVAADTAAQANFTNTYYKTGDLTVTKTVTGGAGDRSRYFTFTVTLSESLTGTYGGMTFTEGVATFHLKDGDSRTATGLPAGIGYTVTEAEADRGGYETAATGADGTIPEDGTARADFVNRKELPPPPEPGEGDLTVTKTVSGNATSNMTPFHFTVTLDDTSINGDYGDMTFTNGVAEFTLRHGQSRTATGLPAGTGYTVTEAEANREGYQTTATGDTGTIPDGGAAEAAFDNYRNVTVEEPKPGPLAVRKLVTGEGGDTEQEFTFRVTLDTPLNGTYGDMEFVDGVAEFTLKSDEVKWGRNIPVGTAFTVEELEANEDGYDTIAEGAVGVIQNEVRSEVRFHNHRGPWEPEDDEPWEELEDPEIPLAFLPKTGDDTHLGLWAALLLLSAIGTAAASLTLIRAKRRLVSGKGKHLKK